VRPERGEDGGRPIARARGPEYGRLSAGDVRGVPRSARVVEVRVGVVDNFHIRSSLASDIREAFRHGRMLYETLTEFIVRLADIRRGVYYQKLPRYERSYLEGIIDQLYTENRALVEWRYLWYGEYVTEEMACSEYDGSLPVGFWQEIENGKYFWVGTDREY
jgi:hypothetical protein